MTGGPRRGRLPSSRPPAYRPAVAATEPAAASRVATSPATAAASVLEVPADRRRGTTAAARLEAAQEERPLRPSQGRLLHREALIRAPTAKHVREKKPQAECDTRHFLQRRNCSKNRQDGMAEASALVSAILWYRLGKASDGCGDTELCSA